MASGDLNRKKIQKRGTICIHIADSLWGIVKTHYKASIFQYKLNRNSKKVTNGPNFGPNSAHRQVFFSLFKILNKMN